MRDTGKNKNLHHMENKFNYYSKLRFSYQSTELTVQNWYELQTIQTSFKIFLAWNVYIFEEPKNHRVLLDHKVCKKMNFSESRLYMAMQGCISVLRVGAQKSIQTYLKSLFCRKRVVFLDIGVVFDNQFQVISRAQKSPKFWYTLISVGLNSQKKGCFLDIGVVFDNWFQVVSRAQKKPKILVQFIFNFFKFLSSGGASFM